MIQIADLEVDIASCRLEAPCYEEKMQWDIQVEYNSHADSKFDCYKPKLSLSLFETPPGSFAP